EAQVVAPPADAWVAHAQTVDELAVLPGGVLGVVEVAALGEVVDEAAEIVHVVPVEPDRPLIEGSVRACGLGPDRNVLLLTEANRRGRVVDDDAEVAVGVGLGVLPDMAYHVHRVDPCPYLAVAGVWQALEVAGEASALDGELGAALRGAGDDATAPDLTVGFGPDSGRPLIEVRLAVRLLQLRELDRQGAGQGAWPRECVRDRGVLERKLGLDDVAGRERLKDVAPPHRSMPASRGT